MLYTQIVTLLLIMFSFHVFLKMEDNKVIFNRKSQHLPDAGELLLFDLLPSIFIDQTNIFAWLLKNLIFNSVWQQHWEKLCS